MYYTAGVWLQREGASTAGVYIKGHSTGIYERVVWADFWFPTIFTGVLNSLQESQKVRVERVLLQKLITDSQLEISTLGYGENRRRDSQGGSRTGGGLGGTDAHTQ